MISYESGVVKTPDNAKIEYITVGRGDLPVVLIPGAGSDVENLAYPTEYEHCATERIRYAT